MDKKTLNSDQINFLNDFFSSDKNIVNILSNGELDFRDNEIKINADQIAIYIYQNNHKGEKKIRAHSTYTAVGGYFDDLTELSRIMKDLNIAITNTYHDTWSRKNSQTSAVHGILNKNDIMQNQNTPSTQEQKKFFFDFLKTKIQNSDQLISSDQIDGEKSFIATDYHNANAHDAENYNISGAQEERNFTMDPTGESERQNKNITHFVAVNTQDKLQLGKERGERELADNNFTDNNFNFNNFRRYPILINTSDLLKRIKESQAKYPNPVEDKKKITGRSNIQNNHVRITEIRVIRSGCPVDDLYNLIEFNTFIESDQNNNNERYKQILDNTLNSINQYIEENNDDIYKISLTVQNNIGETHELAFSDIDQMQEFLEKNNAHNESGLPRIQSTTSIYHSTISMDQSPITPKEDVIPRGPTQQTQNDLKFQIECLETLIGLLYTLILKISHEQRKFNNAHRNKDLTDLKNSLGAEPTLKNKLLFNSFVDFKEKSQLIPL